MDTELRDTELRGTELRGRGQQEFTVFVSNLPYNLDRYGLKGVFQRAGEVRHTYIPQGRTGRRGSRYGFVRF